jgi:hypothetical protein
MAAKKKQRAPRLTRKLTAKMLEDLCRRLQVQVNIAEVLEAAARPRADTAVDAFPMLKVLELAAGEHAQRLASIAGLAEIISKRQPV